MAFATSTDLATRLGTTFTSAQELQAEAFLEDATAYLQAEIGQLIEAGTTTYTTRWRGEAPIRLPQSPVTAVTTVSLNGTATTGFDFVDQELHLQSWWGGETRFNGRWDGTYIDVTVTFDYGYATVPAELKTWTLALASQMMASTDGGSLGMPAVKSETIDDYSVTYVTDGSNMSIPTSVLERLRSRYGQGAHVTGVGRA